MTLTAHKTPGHTKGCTTWTFQTTDKGKTYNVVIIGSPNVNAGYKLVNNTRYPEIAKDYETTFRVLKSLPCDIFLGAHGDYYGLLAKYPKLQAGSANPFIDPAGYKAYVAEREQAFRAELKKQSGIRTDRRAEVRRMRLVRRGRLDLGLYSLRVCRPVVPGPTRLAAR